MRQHMPDPEGNALLARTLQLGVPLQLWEWYQEGRPHLGDVLVARRFGRVLAAHGDALLFRSKTRGKTARLFTGLVRAVAMLAFQPGGVPSLYGTSYEAKAILAGMVGAEQAQEYCQQVWARIAAQTPQVLLSCHWHADPTITLQCPVTGWFETASLCEQERLRHQGCSTHRPDGKPIPNSVVERLMRRCAVLEPVLGTWLAEADAQHQMVVARIDPQAAERWVRLHHWVEQELQTLQ